jgi:hypothetical protein
LWSRRHGSTGDKLTWNFRGARSAGSRKGKRSGTRRYRFVDKVPLRDGKDAAPANWIFAPPANALFTRQTSYALFRAKSPDKRRLTSDRQ